MKNNPKYKELDSKDDLLELVAEVRKRKLIRYS